MEGLLLITLILYPLPVAVLAGMVAAIVPELALLTNVPMVTGAEKEPEPSESWAIYVFDENVPMLVKGTETEVPLNAVTQNGEPLIELVVTDKTFTCTWLLIVTPHGNVDWHII